MGEAYCPAFMGQRISEWEAKVMRRADAAHAKAAASASAEVRAHIQEEIATTKMQRRQAIRQQEKARQLDRQREEIHPSSVFETLKTLAPPERESLQVSKARPDSERTSGAQILPIRYRSSEVDR